MDIDKTFILCWIIGLFTCLISFQLAEVNFSFEEILVYSVIIGGISSLAALFIIDLIKDE